jgi:hypothetical protein
MAWGRAALPHIRLAIRVIEIGSIAILLELEKGVWGSLTEKLTHFPNDLRLLYVADITCQARFFRYTLKR